VFLGAKFFFIVRPATIIIETGIMVANFLIGAVVDGSQVRRLRRRVVVLLDILLFVKLAVA
jgi:hypothetical protein